MPLDFIIYIYKRRVDYMICKRKDYNKILKVSQKLDKFINMKMKERYKSREEELEEIRKCINSQKVRKCKDRILCKNTYIKEKSLVK